MTYNYGKQIRVCREVSYILRENNDAGDLSASPRIGKIIDSSTASHGVEERARPVHEGQCLHKKENKCPRPSRHGRLLLTGG